ncbi:MAG: chorismate-binding protein, partial [Muribaculaceae bacterium]|nr:chorismate-binding protein [Muribaculaceae bacterium]
MAGKDGLFFVNCWNTPSKDNVHVAAARAGAPEEHPWPASTQRSAYLESTGRLIKRLKSRGGKCVRSRVSSSGRVSLDLDTAVAELFGRFPDAFCYCYYTPQTGLWAGATPELLIDATRDTVKTMALAGTRRSGTDAPWDIKNIEEQNLVTQFICDAMQECGLNPVIGETHTLRYGVIEHICT